MGKILNEFKAFAVKGNAVDMAVGERQRVRREHVLHQEMPAQAGRIERLRVFAVYALSHFHAGSPWGMKPPPAPVIDGGHTMN